MSKLDEFTATTYSDNRVITLPEEKIDDIIIGASCTHIFNLGFKYSEYVKSSKIIYKQGLDVIITKYPMDFTIEETEYGTTFLTLVLAPEDTLKFKDSYLQTTVQLQIVNVNGETLYNIPSKLVVKEPIGVERYKPNTLEKIKDYVYYAEFTDYDYNAALTYFYGREAEVAATGCSGIRSGNFFGRNLDWFNNHEVSFVTKCSGKKYKSLAVCGGIQKITQDFIESYEYSDSYKLIPFFTLDGINEKGVVCSTNVVPGQDKTGEIYETHALIQTKTEIFSTMVVRYILDNFGSAKEAVEYLRDYVDIVAPAVLKKLNYPSHWLVADETETYVIEMIDGKINILPEQKVMTNFYLTRVNFNENGTVYTPFDVSQDPELTPTTKNNITKHGSGLERYNLLVNHFDEAGQSMEAMRNVINQVRYGRAYSFTEQATNEFPFYTEFVDEYLSESKLVTIDVTVDSDIQTFKNTGKWAQQIDGTQIIYYPSMLDYEQQVFRKGKMEGQTGSWLTNNSSVYDIKNRKLNVIFQEDGEELEYSL